MANQAIALQARAPQQSNILGGALQQGAQMVNMMNQQRAAERQAARAAQEMQLAQEKAGREATQAEIDNAGKLIDLYTQRAGQTMNAAGYQLLLRDMDRDAPEIAEAFRANLPPEQFDRNELLKMVGSIGDNFKATFGPLETEVVQMEDGTFAVARTGGFGRPGVFELEEFRLRPGGAPPPAGAPAQTPMSAPRGGVNATATRGAATGPADLRAQGVDPRSIPSGNPLQPISMTTGAQMGGQPDMTAVVQDMMSSGQISQSNLQLMREMAGPEKDAQLAQILRTNNIQIVPDEQPGMRSAVFRPGQDAAPRMQQVQSMDDYVATGRAARGKPPMQSPMPGSAIVPIERVRQEAEARRETPEEAARRRQLERQAEGETAYTIELEKGRGADDAEFLNRYQSSAATVRNNIALLDQMLGTARVEGRNVVGSAAPGFRDVVGVGIPGLRFIPGTAAADFDALHQQIMGTAFLDAFENLKGGGPISDREGQAATSARTRLGRNISEREYIKAATELRDAMQSALDRSDRRYARITGQAPEGRAAAAQPRTTRSGAAVRNWPGN